MLPTNDKKCLQIQDCWLVTGWSINSACLIWLQHCGLPSIQINFKHCPTTALVNVIIFLVLRENHVLNARTGHETYWAILKELSCIWLYGCIWWNKSILFWVDSEFWSAACRIFWIYFAIKYGGSVPKLTGGARTRCPHSLGRHCSSLETFR